MRIAIQGETGSFSHEAALQFDAGASVVSCMLSADAFTQLETGATDALALPIENTLAGSVVEHFDLIYARDAHIVAETILPIRHTLIGLPGSTVDSIRRVYSHPVALAQCRRFFAEHPRIEPVPFYDTAGAVKQLVKLRDRHAGAIAGEHAALVHKGRILLSGIEDDPANFTRFVLVFPGPYGAGTGRREALPDEPVDAASGAASDAAQFPGDLSGIQKVTLGFQVEDAPGKLAAALTAAAASGANLTKIQSRPVPGRPWSYTFFVDGIVQSPQAADALRERLATTCLRMKEMGRYRSAL